MSSQLSLFTDDQTTERSPSEPKVIIEPHAPPSESATRHRKSQVLALILRRGSITCREVEDTFHRGSASVRELRLDGHLIDTVNQGDRKAYIYRGFHKRVRVTDQLQQNYYQSPHWKRTAAERKSVDGFQCSQCGDRRTLETHHWSYELFNEDILLDLQTYCHKCHMRLHERLKGSKVHFPRSVTPIVAAELGWAG